MTDSQIMRAVRAELAAMDRRPTLRLTLVACARCGLKFPVLPRVSANRFLCDKCEGR